MKSCCCPSRNLKTSTCVNCKFQVKSYASYSLSFHVFTQISLFSLTHLNCIYTSKKNVCQDQETEERKCQRIQFLQLSLGLNEYSVLLTFPIISKMMLHFKYVTQLNFLLFITNYNINTKEKKIVPRKYKTLVSSLKTHLSHSTAWHILIIVFVRQVTFFSNLA